MSYYAYQDDMLFAMSQHKTGSVIAPTGTGKGTVISRSNYESFKQKSKRIKINVIVTHRILLSQQQMQRAVLYFLYKKEVPAFTRICVHSGDAIEYGEDSIEETIWLAQYPDHKCMSVESLEEKVSEAQNLGHDVVIATTYHSLPKITAMLRSLNLKADSCYLDEIHCGVSQDDWFKSLKKFVALSKRSYAFTATPGKQLDRILSLVGSVIYLMDMHTAISRGLICKPAWAIVEVEGNRKQHLAKGVVSYFTQIQKILDTDANRIDRDARILVHCLDSQEVQTIADSHEIRSLIEEIPNLLVAEITSARGARINGVKKDRLEWLETLIKHRGKMIVLHVDICNSGIDIPSFSSGLWTYRTKSETYATQGNGRHGRISREDRVRLENGEISSNDYSNWDKSHNFCGLLVFSDSLKEDEDAFVDLIMRSREQGFDPKDIVYVSNQSGITKQDPFSDDAGQKKGYKQSSIQVAISIRLEEEKELELFAQCKKVDPMNIFDMEIQ